MARLIRVLVVDDHPVVAEGLASAIGQQPDMEEVGVAGSVEEARDLLSRKTVDVGLLDVRLADGLGFGLLEGPREDGPRWIMLSSFDLDEYVRAAFARGAAGYLLKTAPLPHLLAAIRRVAAGGTAIEARHLAALANPTVDLSERERQMVAGVVASRSNDEIAAELGVSAKTVEAYLTRLFARFGVTSRIELAMKAEREGWLSVALDEARDSVRTNRDRG